MDRKKPRISWFRRHSARAGVALAIVALFALAVGGPAGAGDRGSHPRSGPGEALDRFSEPDVIRSYFQRLERRGSVGPEDAYTGAEPDECRDADCERIDVELRLRPGAFRHRDGGLQVAVRWFGDPGPHTLPPGVPGCCGEFDTLNVYLYKDGARVAASEGIIATSQALLLETPENGHYTAWVVSDPEYNVNPRVDYEAVIELEYHPRVRPVRPLLPNLTFRSSRTVTFQTPSFPLFEPDPPPGDSCFASEREEDGADVCLRFDQVIANEGRAPAEVRFLLPKAEPAAATGEVLQRVYRSDGSFVERPGGQWEYHPIHDHFHFTSFAASRLWRSNARGDRLGGEPVAVGEKVSFCMVDVEIDPLDKKGDGPRTYFAPDCLFPTEEDEQHQIIVQGITNGWNDIYEWYLPDQYIEVSDVTDGYYLLESCADPDGVLVERNELDNCAANLIRLTDMSSPDRRAENLGLVGR